MYSICTIMYIESKREVNDNEKRNHEKRLGNR